MIRLLRGLVHLLLLRALGGAVPARFTELAEAGKLSQEALDSLPDPAIVDRVELPTAEQGEAANKVIAADWATKVRI